MEKNWLIRTKSNHILGPVSKEKVLELYKNGSIKPDDEVCSGNGFWFFIREEDMVNRFLLGDEVQSFNPISEAKDVLTSADAPLPSAPASTATDDITMVGGLDLSMLSEDAPAEVVEESPAVEEAPPLPQEAPVTTAGPKKKPKLEVKAKPSVTPKRPLKKQSYLKYLGILGFLLLFALVYFRKTIIRSLFEGEMTLMSQFLLSPAYAQEDIPEKKKSF